ncbi:MAG: alpha/beta fold hydrolase [Thermoanaerobaculia bacterium]|jgi:pimeloyl-ACP methyl ester carboxylesterase|nr:alpha/beta fold hydrolase [Thermoanaerobaculia bacterium]MBP9822911.1 alpha/beta fold hydrolase [Thermoanaerobaculia bacterium]
MTGSQVLTHRIEGEGPPVVLLNGGMMTFPSWEAVAAPLRARYRLLRFDFRGQLLSPPSAADVMPSDLAGHAADVEALLDRLGWESAHLIGASFGAEVALELTASRPERVRSLVVITAMDRETPEFRRGSDEMRAVLARRLEGGDQALFYDLLVESVYSAGYRRAEAATLAARRAQTDQLPRAWFEGVDRLLAALEGFDLSARLHRVRGRALALLAADDRIMDEDRARALAAAIGAAVAVHPTSGHALVVEDPDWVASACLDFLDETEGRKR